MGRIDRCTEASGSQSCHKARQPGPDGGAAPQRHEQGGQHRQREDRNKSETPVGVGADQRTEPQVVWQNRTFGQHGHDQQGRCNRQKSRTVPADRIGQPAGQKAGRDGQPERDHEFQIESDSAERFQEIRSQFQGEHHEQCGAKRAGRKGSKPGAGHGGLR